jgi:hypothetical protein
MLDKTKSIGSVVLLFAIWVAGLILLIAIGRLIKFLPPGISDILCVGIFVLFVVFMLPSIRDEVKVRGAVNFLPSLELLVGLVFVVLFWLGFYKLANYVISQASAWFQRMPFAAQDYCCGGAILVLVALLGLLIYGSNTRGGQAERL